MKKLLTLLMVFILTLCFAVIGHTASWKTEKFERFDTRTNRASATLEILEANDDYFSFKINSSNGANIGQVSGFAYIDNNTAVFNDNKGGILKFTLSGNQINIQSSDRMSSYGGIGVVFHGTYVNAQTTQKRIEQHTYFTECRIFKNDQEKEFLRVVGAEYYQKFKNASQIISPSDNLDNSNARVYKNNVRGLFTIMESIIMIRDSDNAIWAALIDGDKVLYFTNTKDTELVPITISRWHDRFKNKPIYLIK